MFRFNRTGTSAPAEELPSSSDLASRRAKFEDERMSRRQALKKIGITAGMALVALPSIDELARLAGKQLASSGSNSDVANSVAKGLRSAGVAFADPSIGQEEQLVDPGSHPGEPYWTPAGCQSRCEKSLIDALKDKIKAAGKDAENALDQCKKDNPGGSLEAIDDVSECFKGWILQHNGFKGGAGMAEWISVKNYLECCYGLCDASHEGSDCCGYASPKMNKNCLRRFHAFEEAVILGEAVTL